MSDEMYFSNDDASLLRGKRDAARTEVCRPCLLKIEGETGPDLEGVVLDVTPVGMRLRTLEKIMVGTNVSVQLMRDESFREPLSRPIPAKVVRHIANAPTGFVDHGIRRILDEHERSTSHTG